MAEWICGRCYTRLTGEAAGVCPACGGDDVIPAASPRGQQLIASSTPPVSAQPAVVPRPAPGHVVCPTCYAVGPAKSHGPGAVTWLLGLVFMGIGLFVTWLAFIPAILLGIYQAVATKKVCSHCGNVGIVPGDSQRALEILSGRR
jgi:hypothetical protein